MKTNTKNQIEKLGSQSAQCVETAKQQKADAPAKPTSTARQAVEQAVSVLKVLQEERGREADWMCWEAICPKVDQLAE